MAARHKSQASQRFGECRAIRRIKQLRFVNDSADERRKRKRLCRNGTALMVRNSFLPTRY